jgi:hypothetical protein
VPVSAGEERRLGLEVAKGSPENERIGLSASGREPGVAHTVGSPNPGSTRVNRGLGFLAPLASGRRMILGSTLQLLAGQRALTLRSKARTPHLLALFTPTLERYADHGQSSFLASRQYVYFLD